MKDNSIFKFTCKECGSHTLIVTHVWNVLAGVNSERWQEWGPLEEDHHWNYQFREKIEEDTDDEVERGDFGALEEDDSSSEPEEYEVYGEESDQENDEYFVNCGNCDCEIEFGWSKPGRGGLIWPVDFSDFVPEESWPDPKYIEIWHKRGWLQTGTIQSSENNSN